MQLDVDLTDAERTSTRRAYPDESFPLSLY